MKLKFHHCPAVVDMLPKRRQDFHHRVILKFEDGSRIVFEYAFARLVRGNNKRLEVYTEHCGYHAFSAASLVEVTQEQYGRRFRPGRPLKSRDRLYFLRKYDNGGEVGTSLTWTDERETYRK